MRREQFSDPTLKMLMKKRFWINFKTFFCTAMEIKSGSRKRKNDAGKEKERA